METDTDQRDAEQRRIIEVPPGTYTADQLKRLIEDAEKPIDGAESRWQDKARLAALDYSEELGSES